METSTRTLDEVEAMTSDDDITAISEETAHRDTGTPPGEVDAGGVTGPAEVVAVLEERELGYEVLGEHAVRVVIPSGDVVMGAVPLLSEVGSAVAVLAEGRDASSAVIMRDGQDLFVVRRDPGVWEHFRSMGGPSAVIGSWRSGERTRFRQRHGALWQAIPPALDLAARLGVADLMPQETPPPPPPVREKKTSAPRRTAGPRKTASTRPAASRKAEKKPEAAPAVCPRCFVQLPASGSCDC